MNKTKKSFNAVVAALLVLALVGLTVQGADLTPGYVFISGERNVTHTKLNGLVNAAVINSTFITDKSAATTAAASDVLLIYSVGAADFRKLAINSLLYTNATIITTQTEDTAPATNDFVLTYDTSATSLKKASLANVIGNVTVGVLTNLTEDTAPQTNDLVMTYDTSAGVLKKAQLRNLDVAQRFIYTNNLATMASEVDVAHGLPGRPQLVQLTLLCTNADATQGWKVGDEIDAIQVMQTDGSLHAVLPAFKWGGNATNVFAKYYPTTPLLNPRTGVTLTFTSTKWEAHLTATWHPRFP